MNHGRIVSSFFDIMATAVIRDAGSTVLAQQQVQELYDSINKSSNVKSLLGSILNLFCEVNTIEIINNDKLNEISEQLTRLLATYLSSRNKNFEAPVIMDSLHTYLYRFFTPLLHIPINLNFYLFINTFW